MILLTAWCLLPALIGWLLAELMLPRDKVEWNRHLLALGLGTGLGQGLSSLFFFFWIVEWRLPFCWLLTLEILLPIALAGVWHLCRRRLALTAAHTMPAPMSEHLNWFGMLFLVQCSITVIGMGLIIANHPIGGWDAWAFWNHRAIFLTAGLDCFYPSLCKVTHGDYPLLLPCLVAQAWALAGIKFPLAPALVAALWSLATVSVVVGSVGLLRGQESGWLAGFTLLGAWLFVRMGIREYADMPLAFWVVATIACICLYELRFTNSRGLIFMAGLCAGCGAWTKNEGILLSLACCGAWFLTGCLWRQKQCLHKELIALSLGMTPLLGVVIMFKIKAGVPNELFRPETIQANIMDWPRYGLILQTFIRQWLVFHNWGLTPYWLLLFPWAATWTCRPSERRGLAWSALTILGILWGYFSIYVITPNDVTQHMSTSLERLYIHIWPALVLCYHLALTLGHPMAQPQPNAERTNALFS
ncbi:conserved membrane hypothetical protein [Desulfovibrionales bacterium]